MTQRLAIQVEPSSNGKLFYLPLAPEAHGETERLKIGVALRITNITNDSRKPETVKVKGIDFTFPGSAVGTQPMKGETISMEPHGGRIQPGETATWTNGRVVLANGDAVHNEVYLNAPAPPQISVNVHCDDFSESVTMDLIRYHDPTGHGGFILPIAASDLDDLEYLVTGAVHHYTGGSDGSQIFAHDFFVQSQFQSGWSSAYDPAKKTKNEDVRIFGRTVRAMADGEVFGVDQGYDDNELGADDRPEGVPIGGNHLWVTHGHAQVEYVHLRHDSIVVADGDHVVAGQKLGEAGNSGNTHGTPHLHVECRDTATSSLRPFVFKHAGAVERSQLLVDGTGPWVHMYSRGVCQPKAALLPYNDSGFEPRRPWVLADIDEQLETLVAEVFGGVSSGGGGFAIVGGKFVVIGPRGPKWALLQSLVALEAAEKLEQPQASRLLKDIAGKLAKLSQDLGK